MADAATTLTPAQIELLTDLDVAPIKLIEIGRREGTKIALQTRGLARVKDSRNLGHVLILTDKGLALVEAL